MVKQRSQVSGGQQRQIHDMLASHADHQVRAVQELRGHQAAAMIGQVEPHGGHGRQDLRWWRQTT